MLLLTAGTYRSAVSPRALLARVSLVTSLAAVAVALPATAGAYATIAPPPNYSTAPGLPDGRVYEQVSPANKNGNEAGVGTGRYLGALSHYALAAADGNGVLFEGTGAMGEATAGYNLYFEAQRSAAGWRTRAIMPRTQQPTTEGTLFVEPFSVDPSSDLSHVVFAAEHATYAPPPDECEEDTLYLSGPDPSLTTTWLTRPEIANPIEPCVPRGESGAPDGGTPDFSTVYFAYPGTLLPEDASRAPHATGEGIGLGKELHENVEAWGFYEDREGALREAGVLPDGSLDPFGAVPAASGHGRAITGNQVSADGSRAFFVSPDPASCGRGNNCAVDPPELYVRENGEKTVLVSQDTLLPDVNGLPAGSPDGALGFTGSTQQISYIREGAQLVEGTLNTSFVFASPDGSQAFFESKDDLTEPAKEASPGAEPKMYDFDVETGSLTYLPGVVGQIVTSDQDGSSFAFVSPEAAASSAELELWSGPKSGTVTPITQLTGRSPRTYGSSEPLDVPVARMSSDGSVLVFMSSLRLPGGFYSGTELEQIYRYDVPANTLSCVSCAPAGVTPTSNAEMSVLQANENGSGILVGTLTGRVDERGVSSDGDRIFFDTADPLVPQASDGVRNVYEWENGTIYLISSGKSPENSFFFDNSESGNDVFLATSEGLVPGDTDGAYDVYDARVPHPGDNPPPAAVACEGSVCQGPPNVPSPLTPPASATFSGLGNVVPPAAPPAVKPKTKPLTRAQKLAKALKACAKKPKKKRAACKKQARKQYATAGKKGRR